MEVPRQNRPSKQRGFGTEGDGVCPGVNGCHIVGLRKGQAQPAALADRVVNDAPVTAQYPTLHVHEVTGCRGQTRPLFDDPGIVSIGDEADILTVGFPGVDKALRFGNGSGLRFGQSPQGKARMGQLVLRHVVEHIALILLHIQGLFQIPATAFRLNAGIVAGDDHIAAQLLCAVIEAGKFQITVAVNTWIRRPALQIGSHELVDDLLAEGIGEVEHMVDNPHAIGYCPRVLHVVQCAAGVLSGDPGVLILIELHGTADTVPARLLHEPGGNGGVHTAAHGDQCFHGRLLPLTFRAVFLFPELFGSVPRVETARWALGARRRLAPGSRSPRSPAIKRQKRA